jgi:hypothetical protein
MYRKHEARKYGLKHIFWPGTSPVQPGMNNWTGLG